MVSFAFGEPVGLPSLDFVIDVVHRLSLRLQAGARMSIVNCPECSGTVEDTAITCVHCGAALIIASADSTALPPFFAVSILKLAVMSFFTLGLYEL